METVFHARRRQQRLGRLVGVAAVQRLHVEDADFAREEAHSHHAQRLGVPRN
jgi:hypothetical protein